VKIDPLRSRKPIFSTIAQTYLVKKVGLPSSSNLRSCNTFCSRNCGVKFYFLMEKKKKKKGAQTWLLARSLFFLVGEWVPQNNKRTCLQLHIRILFSTMAPEIDPIALPALAQMIESHHEIFTEEYQIPISPKMHYNVHIPTEIRRLVLLLSNEKFKRTRSKRRLKPHFNQ